MAGAATGRLPDDASPTDAAPGQDYTRKRTLLLIQAALMRGGCGESTMARVHAMLTEADVVPLLSALRHHCAFTFLHSLRTMTLVLSVARAMKVDDSEHTVLAVGALLHDIGKLSLPIKLLRLSRSLRPAEIDQIRTHPQVGYDSVSDKRVLGWNAVLDIIAHHHEYLDGTGYPFGLAAPQITWRTRCVTICDVFSALTEDRPYRPAMSRDDAFAILTEMAEAGKLEGEILAVLRRL